ncbi:hypothetical protein Tco_0889283 [Tanacetum coccineum]
MAAVEVPQTLEYRGGQLNAAPVLEPENQWTGDERKAANLDQRFKSLIMSVLPDDQMNSIINCFTAKSTWDDLILDHEGPSDVKESRDFQDSPDDEEDTRSSHEYLNDLVEEYQARALLAKSKRFFKKEDMELESTNSGPTAKLPILKLGEYEMWAIRIKQYFQIQDYALWEVIENGDSWVSVSQTSQENGITVTKMSTPATAEEKISKKNDVKAKGLLLMALPNEHQLTFSQYPDAKSMFAAIETRFGGNAATKKTQKTLLKQQYENFSATSSESLDFIFNRL